MAEEIQPSPPKEDKEVKIKDSESFVGKFQSHEEAEKAYKELEKKLGQQSEEVGQARKELDETRKYQMAVAPYVQLLDTDENLRKDVFKKLNIPTDDVSTPVDTKIIRDTVQKEVAPYVYYQRGEIFSKFEQKYGIDQLEEDPRKEMKGKIGDVLKEYYPGGIETIPNHRLGKFLEDAYVLANKDLLIEQGKLEGRVAERELTAGAIGSMASGEAKTSEITLTPAQREVAEKAKLSEKEYAESLAKIEAEKAK